MSQGSEHGAPSLGDVVINIHMPAFWGGGAERSLVRLANFWVETGRHRVRMVVNSAVGPVLEHLDKRVDVVDLGALRTRSAFPRLCAWLRTEQPELLVSVLPSAIIATSAAIRTFSRRTAHVALVRNHTTGELAHAGAEPELRAAFARSELRRQPGCATPRLSATGRKVSWLDADGTMPALRMKTAAAEPAAEPRQRRAKKPRRER